MTKPSLTLSPRPFRGEKLFVTESLHPLFLEFTAFEPTTSPFQSRALTDYAIGAQPPETTFFKNLYTMIITWPSPSLALA